MDQPELKALRVLLKSSSLNRVFFLQSWIQKLLRDGRPHNSSRTRILKSRISLEHMDQDQIFSSWAGTHGISRLQCPLHFFLAIWRHAPAGMQQHLPAFAALVFFFIFFERWCSFSGSISLSLSSRHFTTNADLLGLDSRVILIFLGLESFPRVWYIYVWPKSSSYLFLLLFLISISEASKLVFIFFFFITKTHLSLENVYETIANSFHFILLAYVHYKPCIYKLVGQF